MSFTSAKSRPTFTFDALLEMKDAGLVAESGAATVDGSAKVLDAGTGLFEGTLVIDVSAIEVASNDEAYKIAIEGSTTTGFSSGTEVELAALTVGAHEATGGDTDSATGRYTLPFNNREVDATCYRYLRVYTTVAGSVATGINYSAFIAQR